MYYSNADCMIGKFVFEDASKILGIDMGLINKILSIVDPDKLRAKTNEKAKEKIEAPLSKFVNELQVLIDMNGQRSKID